MNSGGGGAVFVLGAAVVLGAAIVLAESGGDPLAVSQAGAVGLMQLLPATARRRAKELGRPDFDLRDPAHMRSSGTPFAQIAAQCEARDWPFYYACLGVSRASNTRALFQRAEALDVLVHEDREFNATRLDAIMRDIERFVAR